MDFGDWGISMTIIRMAVLGVLFLVEGFFYIIFAIWQTAVNRLEFYMAPPGLETLAYGFFFVMLGIGAFFVTRAFFLLTGPRRLLLTDLYVSAFSFPLWFLPALVSFGNANTYFTTAPVSLRPYAYSNLMTGIMFSIIGTINVSSMIYIGWLRISREKQMPSTM